MFNGLTADIFFDNGFTGVDYPTNGWLTGAQNVFYKDGKLQKLPGLTKLNETAVTGTPTCYGLFRWEPAVGQEFIISAWSNGKVYKNDGFDITGTEIKDYGAALTGPVNFVKCGRESSSDNPKLIVLTEGQAPFYLDGTSNTPNALTGVNVNWTGSNQPSSGSFNDLRSILFGDDENPNIVYFSTTTDNTDFSSAGYKPVQIFEGFGERVRAAIPFLTDRIYILKDKGIFYLAPSTLTGSAVPVYMLSETIGIAGNKAWVRIDNYVVFLDQNAHLRILIPSDNSFDVEETNLSRQLQLNDWIEQYVDKRNLQFASLTYNTKTSILSIALPSKTAPTQDLRILVNMEDRNRPKITFDLDRGEYFQSQFIYKDKLHCAGNNGFVYDAEHEDRDIDAASYSISFSTPETDFSDINPKLAEMKKSLKYVQLWVEGTVNENLSVDLYVDGRFHSTNTINLAGLSAGQLDSFVLDSSKLGNKSAIPHKVRFKARGQRFKLRIRSTSTNNFKILKGKYWFNPARNLGET